MNSLVAYLKADLMRTKIRYAARNKFYRELVRYLKEGRSLIDAIDSAWNVL